ncbi:hypothetical protein ACFW04_010637 [Cataglyphis niger]
MILHVFSAFSVVVFGLCIAEELPVTICKRNSPDYSNCLKLAIQEAWPRFVKGLPEFDFPSLDPLSYEHGNFVFDRGEVHGNVNMENVICEGLKIIRFSNIKSHFLDDVFRLEIDTQVPRLFIDGDCEAEGRIGGFRMGGKGMKIICDDKDSIRCQIIMPLKKLLFLFKFISS